MTPKKNKGRTAAAQKKNSQSESYRLSCFVCFSPHEGAAIGSHIAQQRHADGREIFIRYDICPTCIDELKASGRPDPLLDFRDLRLRLQLEPLAARIAKWEADQ
jgi:hypothetical protein